MVIQESIRTDPTCECRITATEEEIAERKAIEERWKDYQRTAQLDDQIRGLNNAILILQNARSELRKEYKALQEKYRRG